MATGVTRCGVPARQKPRSQPFQDTLIAVRHGRSYREFARDIAQKTGVQVSYSQLKRVEDGERAPDPALIFALERLTGATPSPILSQYVGVTPTPSHADAGSDLIGHQGDVASALPRSATSDQSPATRPREIERLRKQLADSDALIGELRDAASRLLAIATRGREAGAPARTAAARGRRDRKAR